MKYKLNTTKLFYNIVWLSSILYFGKITYDISKINVDILNWICYTVIGVIVVSRFLIKIK